MNLRDAELQQTTGFPIVRGRFSIGLEADIATLGILRHDRLLLEMQEEGPFTLYIWPVINGSHDDHGFCIAALGDYGFVFDGLRAQDIGELSSPEARQSFVRGGLHAGVLAKREERLGSLPKVTLHTPIDTYELKAEYRSDGLHFSISGRFASGQNAVATQDGPMLNSKPFSIDAVIPWATLMLKDFSGAMTYWKYGHAMGSPSKDDSPDRIRDPRSFRDLLIDQTLCSPMVRGAIAIAPESALPRRQDQYATTGFLHAGIGTSGISFFDVPRIEILDNGFAWTSISIRSLSLAMLGRSELERQFRERNSFSMSLAGDSLGWLHYALDDTERVAPNMICQQISAVSLRMALGKSGLEILAEGELDVLKAMENQRHCGNPKFQNLQSNPIRTYALSATVPWALLTAKGFGFADRLRRF